jgi:hypothetical protein
MARGARVASRAGLELDYVNWLSIQRLEGRGFPGAGIGLAALQRPSAGIADGPKRFA